MKITVFKIQKDRTKTYRRHYIQDVINTLRDSKYINLIKNFRADYPLYQREGSIKRKELIDYALRDLPNIIFSTECEKKNGKERILAYNPLLMLTISNLHSTETAKNLRNRAGVLPYTRLAFIGADGVSMNIVCEIKPLATTDDNPIPFLHRAYKMLSRIYSDFLRVSIDKTDDIITESCRMSYDPDLYHNPHSTSYPVDMQLNTPELTSDMPICAPIQVIDRDDRNKWRRIYIDNLRKAQNEAFNAPDQSFETLLLLARYCHETNMPQALAEGFTIRNGEYCDMPTLVRDTFATEYETEVRKAYPEKHLNQTAKLMMRTQQFMNTHFRMRRNVLNGAVEYRNNDGSDFEYHLLTKEAMNTMTHMALASGLNTWDKDLNRYINSHFIPSYDPVNEWLSNLPAWDGKDRVTAIARRVPTDTLDWEHNFHVWMRSMVAQWMGRDDQHGNAIAPILIGGQNTGKTSFCRILLPEHLMYYYNDSIDFKDDRGVFLALSSFALINIDEFDSLTKRQQPLMKFILSKADVKYRAAYKTFIEQHKRYASFIGTTNNLQPLNDPTGSRRFICVHVTGVIDHTTPIDYDQLYAQLREEVIRGERYWFTKEEGDRITMLNQQFHCIQDLETMIKALYRLPMEGEKYTPVSLSSVAEELQKAFPLMEIDGNVNMKLARPMLKAGFSKSKSGSIHKYNAILRNQS